MKNLTESDKFMIFILLMAAMLGFFIYKVQVNKLGQDSTNLYQKASVIAKDCPLAKDYFQKRIFEDAPLSKSDMKKAQAMCDKAELFKELNQ